MEKAISTPTTVSVPERLRAAAGVIENELVGLEVSSVLYLNLERTPDIQVNSSPAARARLLELGGYWSKWFVTSDAHTQQRTLRIDNLRGFSVWLAERKPYVAGKDA